MAEPVRLGMQRNRGSRLERTDPSDNGLSLAYPPQPLTNAGATHLVASLS